jgi:hypothetical protein
LYLSWEGTKLLDLRFLSPPSKVFFEFFGSGYLTVAAARMEQLSQTISAQTHDGAVPHRLKNDELVRVLTAGIE